MKIIGITGKIASGKSLISFYFKQLRYPIFDADLVVHKMYKTHKKIISKIRKLFPDSYINRQIDRKFLSQYLIQDSGNWSKLECIVHPFLMHELNKFICLQKRLHSEKMVINMPLLFETKTDKLCHKIIYAHTGKKLQNARLRRRVNYKKDLVIAIMAKQKVYKKKSAL